MKVFITLVAVVTLSGCYVHYPSIGVPGNRVKSVNWSGEKKQKCCFVALDIDTGMKSYTCENMYPSQCVQIHRKTGN